MTHYPFQRQQLVVVKQKTLVFGRVHHSLGPAPPRSPRQCQKGPASHAKESVLLCTALSLTTTSLVVTVFIQAANSLQAFATSG